MSVKAKLKFYIGRIKAGRIQEMWRQTIWIYGYGRRYWKQMVFYTLLGMVSTVIALLNGLVGRDLVDMITGHQTGKIVQTFLLMIGINVFSTLISQLSNYASSLVSMKVDAEIKADIFEKILVTDWESLTNYHTGDLLVRWSSDAASISSGVLNYVPNALIYIFRFLSAFLMVVYYDWTFAVFAFLGLPVSVALSRTLMSRMVNNNKRAMQMSAKMSGFNQESFSNIQTIKAFSLIGLYVEHLKQLQKEYIDMKLDFQKMSFWTSLLLSTVAMAVSYISYGWGIYRVWSGVISYGTMTMFLGLSGTLTGTLHNMTSLIPGAIGLTTSAGRLMDIVEMPREDFSGDELVKNFEKEKSAVGIGVDIKKINYAYNNGTEVFSDADFEAYPNEVVALVGPSGEGKTTMLRLMLALMRPQSGEIKLVAGDNSQSVDITPAARQIFSYVPQGNTMFSGTIAYNMRTVKPDATDEEIIGALKLACAWEFVEKLPEGINSMIKERGGGLSEGQAQRLSIARAILRRSPILLLDEATSALDMETEKRMLANIMHDTYPRTCIITTHRPGILEYCNRVYEIKDKKCIEKIVG